jgi:hypothetical protein
MLKSSQKLSRALILALPATDCVPCSWQQKLFRKTFKPSSSPHKLWVVASRGAEGKELVQISPLLPCSSANLHPAILGWRTTRLALVDDALGKSALLSGENQDCSVEAIFPHEGTGSAASVAQN